MEKLKVDPSHSKNSTIPIRNRTITIATLGPHGTSSEHATKYYADSQLANVKTEILLLDSFDSCLTSLISRQTDYCVVPHAYENIQIFYMTPDVYPVDIFRCDTPLYGLAALPDVFIKEEDLQNYEIVTHKAPIDLLKNYLKGNLTVKIVNSTSLAAILVKEGKYKLALTNKKAVEKYELQFIKTFQPIPMSWSIFTLKDEVLFNG
ncbi:bacilysin biosynthesis protein BacA [Evansella caseinilytica]|uniref:Bacilysin biosynthesis protein BacA n=1 Tax=Evansella caseinilytica TaxID=1503961 RepID=A0A1H3G492_9BACI|nr:hypothetical protein [Evansella caseinilytica]SDX97905.1 bacilysin biosynthesis protein BacA [Evansella caseinilytica]